MRFAYATLLLLSSASVVGRQATQPKSSIHPAPKLELKLIAENKSIHSGERLKLRIELWNIGSEDVIVAQNLDSAFGNSTLGLILDTVHGGESSGYVADNIPDSSEPDFEQTFVTSWLTLNKNHFIGTYVEMDPVTYPHLRKPGTYKIHALYLSRGILSTPGWNGSYLKQADVDKLPLAAFQGSLNSNPVSIKVTTASGH